VTGDLVFYALAAVTVISGFCVVFCRNIVHAAFSLLFTLLGVAGLFGLLAADFLTVIQILVYVGGVLVLVVFTVMMTGVPGRPETSLGAGVFVSAGIFSLAVFAAVYRVITTGGWSGAIKVGDEPTTAEIGTQIMTNYILPFEYVSLALLVAMIGAAIVIRERRQAAAGPVPVSAEAVAETEPAAADPTAGDSSEVAS
jgi:NADH-quinone oxidoreductase subunit J